MKFSKKLNKNRRHQFQPKNFRRQMPIQPRDMKRLKGSQETKSLRNLLGEQNINLVKIYLSNTPTTQVPLST